MAVDCSVTNIRHKCDNCAAILRSLRDNSTSWRWPIDTQVSRGISSLRS